MISMIRDVVYNDKGRCDKGRCLQSICDKGRCLQSIVIRDVVYDKGRCLQSIQTLDSIQRSRHGDQPPSLRGRFDLADVRPVIIFFNSEIPMVGASLSSILASLRHRRSSYEASSSCIF